MIGPNFSCIASRQVQRCTPVPRLFGHALAALASSAAPAARLCARRIATPPAIAARRVAAAVVGAHHHRLCWRFMGGCLCSLGGHGTFSKDLRAGVTWHAIRVNTAARADCSARAHRADALGVLADGDLHLGKNPQMVAFYKSPPLQWASCGKAPGHKTTRSPKSQQIPIQLWPIDQPLLFALPPGRTAHAAKWHEHATLSETKSVAIGGPCGTHSHTGATQHPVESQPQFGVLKSFSFVR